MSFFQTFYLICKNNLLMLFLQFRIFSFKISAKQVHESFKVQFRYYKISNISGINTLNKYSLKRTDFVM